MNNILVKIDSRCYAALDAHDNTPSLRTNHRGLYPWTKLVYLSRYPFNGTGLPVRRARLSIRLATRK